MTITRQAMRNLESSVERASHECSQTGSLFLAGVRDSD